MTIFTELAVINKLKDVERGGLVGNRAESTAEHVYSAMVLAEYYLKKVKGLDEKKVLKLLLYHDLVEIYSGDLKIWDKDLEKKKKLESEAMKRLLKNLPKELAKEINIYWKEYEKARSREALFAHAIDTLDALIHNQKNASLYQKYALTEKRIKSIKSKYYESFPFLKKHFEEILQIMKKNKIII
jgi:putative hydrolases of HD superfamily